MIENQWQEIVGTPISADEAFRILDDWRVRGQEIGMLYCARSATAMIASMCRVRAVRNGLLQVSGESGGASLNLKLAKFTYGPMQVWPRWPAGPSAEVLALQAYLPCGDWLVLAEGYLPKELSPLALPM